MKIDWSHLSLVRVGEIADYIAQDSLVHAREWISNIFNEVKRLEQFPEIGRITPELGNTQIRELIYQNFRIIYKIVSKNRIIILTVRHGKRLLQINNLS